MSGADSSRGPAHRVQNWPNHVRFIKSLCYHSSIPSSVRQHIQGSAPSSSSPLNKTLTGAELRIVIRRINQASHPAFGQFGLFAGQKIPQKCHIIYYLGAMRVLTTDGLMKKLRYRLPGDINVGIDATAVGNQARFINDYRGIASKPNAVFQEGRTSCGESSMSIWSANQEIKKGEEIVVSYGKSWWRSRDR